MSSMIKKKGALSFKPKAPQARRPAGAPPSQASSTPRPSVDRQSQTPAPVTRPAPTQSPPPPSISASRAATRAQSHHGQTVSTNVPAIQAAELTSDLQPSGARAPSISRPSPPVINDPSTYRYPLPTPPATQYTSSLQDKSNQIPSASTLPSPSEAAVSPTHSLNTDLDTEGNATSTVRQPGVAPLQSGQRPDTTSSRSENVYTDLSSMGAGESADASSVVPIAPLNIDGTSGTIISTPATGRRKQPTKRRRPVEDDASETGHGVELQPQKKTRVPKALIPKKPRARKEGSPKQRKRKRAATPEDAEDQEIDQSTIKMAELCKDPRIGRKFSKHDEIRQREIDKKIKARLMRDNPELLATEDGRGEAAPEAEPAIIEPTSNITFRVVNGAIVQDERSMLLDRHAEAAANMDVMEVVEENEFTKVTTSGTYMKRVKSSQWDLESYEKFYTGIRMFGTDFEMIAQMFPDRNRRQIKLKFNKEEREHPDRIHKALLGEKMEIDFEEYKQHTGLDYEETADIEREYTATEEKNAADEATRAAELEKSNRDKRAAIHGTSRHGDGAGGADSAKENEAGGAFNDGKASAASRSNKSKGKKKKNQHSAHGGGEEVEVLGDI